MEKELYLCASIPSASDPGSRHSRRIGFRRFGLP